MPGDRWRDSAFAWPTIPDVLEKRVLLFVAYGGAQSSCARLVGMESTRESDRLIDELTRAIDGDPWHGDALFSILRGVSARTAAATLPNQAHSIWEILRHITAWTGEVTRRLDGNPPGLPPEGDWPPPAGRDDADWASDLGALVDAHRALLRKVSTLSDTDLHAPPPHDRNRPAGSGVTRYVMLHGLAQHHAYHAGQIALLKKILL
jgi:uncharacterized damage-inducible protein DinB